jgi:hypothetical protein
VKVVESVPLVNCFGLLKDVQVMDLLPFLVMLTADTTNTPATPIPDKTRYLHYDNLGSIDTITDGQGNIVERMSYAAFGERRKGERQKSFQ